MSLPTPVSARNETMDVLRGVAVLGILLVNINSFALPIDATYELTEAGYESAADAWVFAAVSALGTGKFMSMFALLFGAGVAMMVDKRREAGIPAAGLHYRRLAALGVVGLVHGVMIWYGDILLSYAICGAVLYPILLLKGRRLAWLCAGLWGLALVLALGVGALIALAEAMTPQGQSEDLFENEAELMRGGLPGIAKVRLVYWLLFMVMGPLFIWPWVLALMVTGALAKRHGWITGQRPRRDDARLLAAGLVFGLPVAALRVGLHLRSDAGWALAIEMPMSMIDAAALCLAWGAGVVLLIKAGAACRFRRAMAAVGRMALSNYLLQSILCTTLFYGYGFALFGRLSRAELLGVVAGVWAVQLLASRLWLSRFERGPAEAAWRRLTHGRTPRAWAPGGP